MVKGLLNKTGQYRYFGLPFPGRVRNNVSSVQRTGKKRLRIGFWDLCDNLYDDILTPQWTCQFSKEDNYLLSLNRAINFYASSYNNIMKYIGNKMK